MNVSVDPVVETTGRLPKVIFAVKQQVQDQEGKRKTYIRLSVVKDVFDRMCWRARLPGFKKPTDVYKTYEGTIEWVETGTLESDPDPVLEPMPFKKGKKKA